MTTETQVTETSAAFSSTFKMSLSEKVEGNSGKKEFKEIAKVSVPCPTLADFGITAEQDTDEETKLPAVDNGIPVYKDTKFDWLQSAILAKVSAQTRNKFAEGALKPGMKVAETFEELTAVGERTGEALKIRHEARKSFIAYLVGKNKKQGTVKLLSDLFHDTNNIPAAKTNYVEALAQHVAGWITGLAEADKVRYASKVESLQESINSASEGLDEADLAAA